MNYRIINMLEEIKLGKDVKSQEYLDDSDIQKIVSWYEKYSTMHKEECTVEKAVDLLYALYVRENITVYPVEEFQHVVEELSNIHSFKADMIWNLLSDFKNMIYGE